MLADSLTRRRQETFVPPTDIYVRPLPLLMTALWIASLAHHMNDRTSRRSLYEEGTRHCRRGRRQVIVSATRKVLR